MNEFYIIGKWSVLNDPTINDMRQSIMVIPQPMQQGKGTQLQKQNS